MTIGANCPTERPLCTYFVQLCHADCHVARSSKPAFIGIKLYFRFYEHSERIHIYNCSRACLREITLDRTFSKPNVVKDEASLATQLGAVQWPTQRSSMLRQNITLKQEKVSK